MKKVKVNSKATRDRLLAPYLDQKLVTSIAKRLIAKFPPSIELDDFIQEGLIGLMRAAAKFRTVRGDGYDNPVPFEAYARLMIRGAILSSCRRRQYTDATHAPLEEAAEPSYTPAIDAQIDAERERKQVAMAAAALPANSRKVIAMYYRDGMGKRQIAEEHGMREAAANEMRRDGLRRMKRELEMRGVRKAA